MKKIHVGDEYRTNSMSLQPGGSVIEVYHESGLVLEYDKIKFPSYYLREVYPKINKADDPILRITVDQNVVFNRSESKDVFKLMEL